MRQLLVQVERGHAREVLQAAERRQAVNSLQFDAIAHGEPVDALILHVSNADVQALIEELRAVPGFSLALLPHESQAFSSREESSAEKTLQVTPRSPVEVYLRSLRADRSWVTFLLYAVLAGALSWVGLFTGTVFLLVAAMLVAPFPSAAMNTAVATARGDSRLLGRSLLRYSLALLVGIGTAALLSVAFGQRLVTRLMESIAFVSETALVLPLVAGAAGAIHAQTSEEDSFVSAAGAGMLVAAALSPPAGVVGMAAVLGEWAMAQRASFLLLLQIVGINLTAAVAFRLYGISASGVWYGRGRRLTEVLSYAATVALFAVLMAWQFGYKPALVRPSVAQDVAHTVQQAVRESDRARLLSSDVRLTTAEGDGEEVLLLTVSIQPRGPADDAQVEREVRQRIEAAVRQYALELPLLTAITVARPLQ